MQLVPTNEEVLALLRQSGALRGGHFECLNGLHTDKYLDIALAMRCYCHQKTLSVGLSRKLREPSDLRALVPDLSFVAVTTAGLPIAYGLCEALRARQVYWAEKEDATKPMRFRQYLEQTPGEKVILVDDVLRAGRLIVEARRLVESHGAQVMGVAVAVLQPTPQTVCFDPLPVYYLARLDATYYSDAAACDLCRRGVPLEKRQHTAAAIAAV